MTNNEHITDMISIIGDYGNTIVKVQYQCKCIRINLCITKTVIQLQGPDLSDYELFVLCLKTLLLLKLWWIGLII